MLKVLGSLYKNPSLSLEQIMHNWIYEPGYPIVTVNLNPDGNSVKLHQVS